MLKKLGFNPESFTRSTPAEERAFVKSFRKTTPKEKFSASINTPLTWALGAIGLYFGHRFRSEDSHAFVPKFTGALLVVVAMKRWSSASKREKQKFVREYNKAMGTTFRVEHPKMKALWELTYAKANKINRLSKYGSLIEHGKKKATYDPTLPRQKSGFDTTSEWRRIRNIPTSLAIRRLGEEWLDREPPKGIYKEVKIPSRMGRHSELLYKYGERARTQPFLLVASGAALATLGFVGRKTLKHLIKKKRFAEMEIVRAALELRRAERQINWAIIRKNPQILKQAYRVRKIRGRKITELQALANEHARHSIQRMELTNKKFPGLRKYRANKRK